MHLCPEAMATTWCGLGRTGGHPETKVCSTRDGYAADAATIEASEGFIIDYLTDVATRTTGAKVHIIAHSMGNRVSCVRSKTSRPLPRSGQR
jgi:hypothetical protein